MRTHFTVTNETPTGDIIEEIRKQSLLIENVTLKDTFENNKTFHIVYQNKEGNLTTKEVAKIREQLLKSLEEKFKIKIG